MAAMKEPLGRRRACQSNQATASKSGSIARIRDRRVSSGIVHVHKKGMRWSDAPAGVRLLLDSLQPMRALEREMASSSGDATSQRRGQPRQSVQGASRPGTMSPRAARWRQEAAARQQSCRRSLESPAFSSHPPSHAPDVPKPPKSFPAPAKSANGWNFRQESGLRTFGLNITSPERSGSDTGEQSLHLRLHPHSNWALWREPVSG